MTTIETAETDQCSAAARTLLSAAAVRERCDQILAAGDELRHFKLHPDRLEDAADYVIDTIRQNYPDLSIPFHARWRHFKIAGVDRWQRTARGLDVDAAEMARIRFDLAVTSVLLDAGAGGQWRYRDPASGDIFTRSEGLALASLDAFSDGFFSSQADRPLMADAAGLQDITSRQLGDAFQVRADNPLEGLDGRATLMNRLGAALAGEPATFGEDTPRIGHLFDAIARQSGDTIGAADLLQAVLDAFGPIWPGRLECTGVNLGDTWRHPQVVMDDETTGLVPFHKLSQWLTYSLIEPLEEAGISVTDIDGLTGLAEYRNGGLFIDLGVIEARDPAILQTAHHPGDEVVVEWRALTVAFLDRIAPIIRQKLGRSRETLPLASILEGGTWAAGRRIAAEKRSGGGPPIAIVSDGSVF